ncbi:MAG: hypothetical protein ACXVK4_06930 [Acidimicrobiia bacterium]
MQVEPEQARHDGLSRRQLLARGAVVGGLVWAAPVIRTTAAYATTANGTERPCRDFFFVVINPTGHVDPGPGDHNANSIPPAIRQWFHDFPTVEVGFPTIRPQLTSTGGEAWAVLLPEVTGPNAAARQCRVVLGWGRKGNDFAEGYVDPNPPLAVEAGRRLLFPCAAKDHGGGGGGGGGGGDHHGGGGGGDGNDDNGCIEGHDDGDHDADDTACDPRAVATAAGADGNGTADAVGSSTTTTTTPPAVGSSAVSATGLTSATDATASTSSTTLPTAASVSSDGSSGGSVGSDGSQNGGITSDGHQSNGGGDGDDDGDDHGGGDDGDHGGGGNGNCLDAIYIIYCCPR